MKGILTIIKIFAFLAVIGVLGGLFYFLREFREDFAQPTEARKEKVEEVFLDESVANNFKRGERDFNRAVELIAMERLDDAVVKLDFIQNLHADSEFAAESRRILGEINLDRVLDVSNKKNKRLHTVAGGEGYLKIANQHETTLDCIMFLNGLLDMKGPHRGDELIVMPLDFKLVVDLKNKRVELFHRDSEKQEHVFTKDYPIQQIGLSRAPKRPKFSKISGKGAELRGRSYPPHHSNYRDGVKVLTFKVDRRTIQLRPVPTSDEEDPGGGVFLTRPDMEELSMLIRVGNEVEIKPST